MRIIAVILFLNSIFITVNGQSNRSDLLKYWRCRDRLKYFIIPGMKQGESEISTIRNFNTFPIINYGQHGVYLGFYIGMLATEYKLHTDNGQDAWNVKEEI